LTGGRPIEIRYGMDPERGQVMTSGPDPAAAARFVEAVVFGEAGPRQGPPGAKFEVREASQLKWLFIHDLELGRKGSIFIGRSTGRAFVASNFEQGTSEARRPPDGGGATTTSSRFPDCE